GAAGLAALPPAPLATAFTRPLAPAERAWLDATLARLSLRDRVAQLVTVWVLGDYAHVQDSSFARAREWIVRDHVGGMVMSLGSPLETAAKVNALQKLAMANGPGLPLLVSSDVEPGLGRLEGGVYVPYLWSAGTATVLPTNMATGAATLGSGTPDVDAAALGRITGRESRAVGIHMAYAPTVDVNNNPANPVINVRSFGEDPAAVARLAAAFVRGVQDEGVAAVAKHFPGHGDTDADSHVALPVVRSDRARLNAVELVPFRAAIAAGVVGIMTAHIALPAVAPGGVPATLERSVMTGLLRDTLGFRGITVTDAMTMEGVGQGYPITRSGPMALAAGDDILLMPSDVPAMLDAIVAAVGRGEIPEARVNEAARRVLELKLRTGAATRPLVDLDSLREIVGAPAHWQTARDVAQRAVTLLRDSAALLPLATGTPIVLVQYAPDAEVTAGTAFAHELRRAGARVVRELRVSPRTSTAALDTLAAALPADARLVVTTYTRTFEGAGRLAIPAHVSAWIDGQAARTGRVVVVAGGNPYVIRQFPRVQSYMVTYGRGDALERAAARAVLGLAPIGGRAPISLPGYFQRGDGLVRGAAVGAR
ncbi:MAG TPA: glycoside hydrolase family 3 N-terminal domain-containing protein, partial [Gemmatirosa sp.]|nr:glycoside hydrolase family 3 N-terminal domain-containing protein [Gemmatirosa sp.]